MLTTIAFLASLPTVRVVLSVALVVVGLAVVGRGRW